MNVKFLISVFTILAVPGLSSAQNFSSPFKAGSTSNRTFLQNRTVRCFVDDNGSYKLSTTVRGPSGETITARRPAVDPDLLIDDLSRSQGFGDSDLSDNFIVFTTTEGIDGAGEYTITMEATDEGSDNPFTRCEEVSLGCSFNTFVNDFNFLEVTNNGSQPAIVSYRATDFDGNTITDAGTIAPGQRADFDIHSKVGPSKFGKIVIHPSVAGNEFKETISAKLSQYKGDVLSYTEDCQRLPQTQLLHGG
jgi:hypothetical protein